MKKLFIFLAIIISLCFAGIARADGAKEIYKKEVDRLNREMISMNAKYNFAKRLMQIYQQEILKIDIAEAEKAKVEEKKDE